MPTSDYDIYIVADVDALKRDYAELWALYEAVVHENAALARENDTLRWKLSQARHEEDFTWMTD